MTMSVRAWVSFLFNIALGAARHQFFDVRPDAFRNWATGANSRMRGVPAHALLARRYRRHPMGGMPSLVRLHRASPRASHRERLRGPFYTGFRIAAYSRIGYA